MPLSRMTRNELPYMIRLRAAFGNNVLHMDSLDKAHMKIITIGPVRHYSMVAYKQGNVRRNNFTFCSILVYIIGCSVSKVNAI